MPELPDVEAVISRIKNKLIGEIISEIKILTSDPIQIPKISEFKKRVVDAKILDIRRQGKFILFPLDNGFTLIIHLRMTGDLQVVTKKQKIHKHTRVVFNFKNRNQLRFVDQRKLGKMYVVKDKNEISLLAKMGPEPMNKKFTLQIFKNLIKNKKGKVKSLLLDQRFIAGIGNVYGDEILFQAKIHPQRKANTLSEKEIKKLFGCIKFVLNKACKSNANVLRFYNWIIGRRWKDSCPQCNSPLARVKIQGRYSWFCPKCQK